MEIINNQDKRLIDVLEQIISDKSHVRISCGLATAYALYRLMPALTRSHKIDLLLNPADPQIEQYEFLHSNAEFVKVNDLNRDYIVDSVRLIVSKARIRKGNTSNINLLIVQNLGENFVFQLSNLNLDLVTLGELPPSLGLYILLVDSANADGFIRIFDTHWSAAESQANFKVKFDTLLAEANKKFAPQHVYKYALKQIFDYTTTSERADEKLKQIGFKNTKIWNMLFNFQKDAVLGAIDKIETYGGCIIADSVGLGKTFEALAVMAYYQLRNCRTLVLAPKKLRENWTIYTQNDKRNILAADRLNFDVLNHTDLSRERGKSGDIDLETINWGNYDLLVIDESHNFRNAPSKRGISRYKKLMNEVIKANIRTKVLMLSATPVNSKLNDLKNQISFITEENDEYFAEQGILSITQVMREAQRRFNQWFKETELDDYSLNELMLELDGSYFKLLDMLTIARSRKHIQKYYDTTDIGKFPTRLKPITHYASISKSKGIKSIADIYDELSPLTLAAYSPLKYLKPEKQEEYARKYDIEVGKHTIFKQIDREQSLIYLMRINLLKRLESSITSFKITLQNTIRSVTINLDRINKYDFANANDELPDLDINDVDFDDPEMEDLLVGGKTSVLIKDIDLLRWKGDLETDLAILKGLQEDMNQIDENSDEKLQLLKTVITKKLDNPINEGNRKVIVFTAFADTANYLFNQLKPWLLDKNLFSALVTGSGKNKTNMPNCRTDLNSILINFAPLAKKRSEIFPNEQNQIDVLICTDCISEGQNLQDCDMLINYDIHWNPVRIIQRFGRIDRIGSKNNAIQLVNFFPDMELDSFIDLIKRVKGRMTMLDVSATGEDNIISDNQTRDMQDLEYRRRQLKQLQDQVLDLEDVQGSITITDLTFNDFKMDVEKSSEAELEILKKMPPAGYAIAQANNDIKPGAIFLFKDTEAAANRDRLRNNFIYPYYLVYVSVDGQEVKAGHYTKTILDYFRALSLNHDKPSTKLIELYNQQTQNGKNPVAYQKLLNRALTEITGLQNEKAVYQLSLPNGTQTHLNTTSQTKLISYLIIV